MITKKKLSFSLFLGEWYNRKIKKIIDKMFLKKSPDKKLLFSFFSYILLNEFFMAFAGLMPFILRKDLVASVFQLSLFTMLKPAVALFSFYGSLSFLQRKADLRFNLILNGLLARVPFLLFPFFDSAAYIIFASAFFVLFSRAAIPSWMEILKQNLNKEKRENLFSAGMRWSFLEGVFIAFFIGSLLDKYSSAWKWFCFFFALLGVIGVFIQAYIFPKKEIEKSSSAYFKNPIRSSLALLKKRKDFLYFQMGTMIAGFSLMLMAPALVFFYTDFLNLSHFDMTVGRYIFMGLGFVFLTPLWTRSLQKVHILHLTGWVCLGFALFSGLILLSFYGRAFFFFASAVYGITQAGSRLVWNLSGPIFAGESEPSVQYTAVNVLTVGLRGLVAPLLGGYLCALFGPAPVFLLAGSLCLVGSLSMVWARRRLLLAKEISL